MIKYTIKKSTASKWLLQHTKLALTPSDLQVLMYFAYAWYLFYYNDSADKLTKKLFKAEYVAYVAQPIDLDLNSFYGKYKNEPIPVPDYRINIPVDCEEFLQKLVKSYGDLSHVQLLRLVESQNAYKKARGKLLPLSPAKDIKKHLLNDKDIYNSISEVYYDSRREN